MVNKKKAKKLLMGTMATAVAVSVLPATSMTVEASTQETITTSEIKTLNLTDIINRNMVDMESGYVFTEETFKAFKERIQSLYGDTQRTLNKAEVQNVLRLVTDDLKVKNKAEALKVLTEGTADEKLVYITDKVVEYRSETLLSNLVDTTILDLFLGVNADVDGHIRSIKEAKSTAQSILSQINLAYPREQTEKYEMSKATGIMQMIQGYSFNSETKDDLFKRYNHKMDIVYKLEMELVNLISRYTNNYNTMSNEDYLKLVELYNKVPADNKDNYTGSLTEIEKGYEGYLDLTGYGALYKQINGADYKTVTQAWLNSLKTEISKVNNINIRTELTSMVGALEDKTKVWQRFTTIRDTVKDVDVTKASLASITTLNNYKQELDILNDKIVSTNDKAIVKNMIDDKAKQIEAYHELLAIETDLKNTQAGVKTNAELDAILAKVNGFTVADYNRDKINSIKQLINVLKQENMGYTDFKTLQERAKQIITSNLGYERAVGVFVEIKEYQANNDKSSYFGEVAKLLIEIKEYTDKIQGTTKYNIAQKYEKDNITGKGKDIEPRKLDIAIVMYELVNHADYKVQVEQALERLHLAKLGLTDDEESKLEISAINAYNEANRRVLSSVYVKDAREKQSKMYTGSAKTELDKKVTVLENELAKVQAIQKQIGEFSQVNTTTITVEKLAKIKTSLDTVQHQLSKEVLTNSYNTYLNVMENLVRDVSNELVRLEGTTRVYDVWVTILERRLAGLDTKHEKYSDFDKRLKALKERAINQTLLEKVNAYIKDGEVDQATVTALKAEFSKATNMDSKTKEELDKQFKLLDEVLLLQKEIQDIKVQLDKAHAEGITEEKLTNLGNRISKLIDGKIKTNLMKQVTELGYAYKEVTGIYKKTVSKNDLLRGVEIHTGIVAKVPNRKLIGVNDVKSIEITYSKSTTGYDEEFSITLKDGTTGKELTRYGGGIVLTIGNNIQTVSNTQTIQTMQISGLNSTDGVKYYAVPHKKNYNTIDVVVQLSDSIYTVKNKNIRFFTDINGLANSKYIQALVERGIVTGTSETTYAPKQDITRGQFSAMVVRAIGLSGVNKEKADLFTDTKTHWGKNDINVLTDLGIIHGYGNGKFGPNDTLTRQQASMMLHRLMVHVGYDLSGVGLTKAQVEAKYKDANKMSEEGKLSIGVLTQLGILAGDGNGNFDPNGKLTRDQMSKVLYKSLEVLGYIN